MKLREWYKAHPVSTLLLLTFLISISVGIMYYRTLDAISFYDYFENREVDLKIAAILSYAIRSVLAAFTLFLIIPYLFYRPPRSLTEYGRELNLVRGSSQTIACGFLSYAIFVLVTAVLALLLGIFTDNPFVFLEQPENGSAGWLYPIAAINPGFFEEIGFRGVLYSNLQRYYSERIAVIGSATLFGLFHLGSLVTGEDTTMVVFLVIMATSFGLSWGYMTYKSKSVIPSIMAHYLIDATSEGLFNPTTTDEILTAQFFMGVIVLYPVLSVLATKLVFRSKETVHT